MLNAKSGNYIMLGAARSGGDPQVHRPAYDFNDDTFATGASYWATLAEQLLPRGRTSSPFPGSANGGSAA